MLFSGDCPYKSNLGYVTSLNLSFLQVIPHICIPVIVTDKLQRMIALHTAIPRGIWQVRVLWLTINWIPTSTTTNIKSQKRNTKSVSHSGWAIFHFIDNHIWHMATCTLNMNTINSLIGRIPILLGSSWFQNASMVIPKLVATPSEKILIRSFVLTNRQSRPFLL